MIFDVVVPKETRLSLKGEPKQRKTYFPGYVLVDMTVTDDSWYVVRNTPNVTGFVGSERHPFQFHRGISIVKSTWENPSPDLRLILRSEIM